MQTARLQLVRLTEDHVAGYHAIWSDPVATRWSAHGPCKTLEDSRQWMSSLLLEANPMGENYAVLLRRDTYLDDISNGLKGSQDCPDDNKPYDIWAHGGFIGWVGTWKTDPLPEVGFIFHRSTWGLGFATEALRAFVELYWLCKPQFKVLEAYCDTENEASVKVLRKCGFELVDVTRKDYILPWMTPPERDTMQFRLIRTDNLDE
ncbi:GNAT domain-containing protein [Aspergillus pseudotamarii]|uniref:GNAT domain-containing protein n=1 Tax=Aspergillus pseudotamarii TaxID=132259 RepID=A0A5N6T2E6_ASPPS|nr:GNAT domain-containing protein [Aspergillus pseudotamarii]KAE8140467.1 GNAT domain-containing protein [Aspergillus pseudotamarii]